MNTLKQCGHCGANNVITDINKGEIVCSGCAVVQEEKIPESVRPYFKEGETIFRGSVSVISSHRKDASGTRLSVQAQKNAQKLRLWDKRSPSAKRDGGQNKSISYVKDVCDKLGVGTGVVREVAMLLQKISEMNRTRGHSKEAILLALIYISSQKGDAIKTFAEIARVSRKKKKEIAKAHRAVCKMLSINSSAPSRSQIITRKAHELGLHEKTSRNAVAIYEKMRDRKLTGGKNHYSIAAVCIALACKKEGISLSGKHIAETTGIMPITLYKCLQEFKETIL